MYPRWFYSRKSKSLKFTDRNYSVMLTAFLFRYSDPHRRRKYHRRNHHHRRRHEHPPPAHRPSHSLQHHHHDRDVSLGFLRLITDGDEPVSMYHDLPASYLPNTQPESSHRRPEYPHLVLPWYLRPSASSTWATSTAREIKRTLRLRINSKSGSVLLLLEGSSLSKI